MSVLALSRRDQRKRHKREVNKAVPMTAREFLLPSVFGRDEEKS